MKAILSAPLIAMALAPMAPGSVQANARGISAAEAEKRCIKRLERRVLATTYGRGNGGASPPPRLRSDYRQCFHGYTGHPPARVPDLSHLYGY